MAKHARLAAAAATLAACCGLAAFVCLVLRDNGHPKVMVNEESAPMARSEARKPAQASPAPQADTKAASSTPTGDNGAGQASGKHTFSLNESTELPVAGSMKLELVKTEPAKKLYDMRVIAGRRWSTHRHLKLNEPLWIAVDKQTAMEMVISSIESDAVSGYWTETSRSAQISPRVHVKHRRTE